MEKRRVVGGEESRRPPQNRGDRRMPFNGFIEKYPNILSLPVLRVPESPVKRQVAFVKVATGKRPGVRAQGRQIENGQVQLREVFGIFDDKIKCTQGGYFIFGGGPEKKIAVNGDAGRMEVAKRDRDIFQIDPFVEIVEHVLVARFDAQLQHNATAFFQCSAKVQIGQMPRDARKSIPGNARRPVDERAQERRGQRAVHKMKQRGPAQSRKIL